MADIIIDGTSIGANRFLFLDSTGKIPAVDGSQVTAIAAGNITTGTIPIARIDTGTTANKIVKLDGNAKLPALDGSLITNVPGATKNASDPTISTNPSGGVGTEWHNTTSGEAYICTDATAGENVWTNIGVGSGDVEPYSVYAGTQYGFTAGGDSRNTTVDKFSFASDGDAVDHCDLHKSMEYTAGHSSGTHGYISGNSHTTGNIVKYAFVSTAIGELVGDLTYWRYDGGGNASETYGYYFSGYGAAPQYKNYIDKFPFASDSNATDVGDTLATMNSPAGQASVTHGYISGGNGGGGTWYNVIQRISFSADGNSTDVGDLTRVVYGSVGSSSETHGYNVGGTASSAYPTANAIEKFSFASSANGVVVGNTLSSHLNNSGCSSTTHGYQCGGAGGGNGNQIQKHTLASDNNATDVGDLTVSTNYSAGHHF
jgi:hypothetical protein